ncbi:hypothetical protein B1806_03970 [Metallibacterium scheffleri]|uniref:Uncharacterized protein n=2 Tax=Metallibacterium scheffleri TaxID=993689 RepID=A0A4S3KSU4_9GAMM|nr:hypothetical protein B1806_03970 [Metallibacterium scheffleri]
MLDWPVNWADDESLVPLGRILSAVFRDFMNDLIAGGASRTTLRRHRGELFNLGYECLRAVSTGQLPGNDGAWSILESLIDDCGGPLLSSRFASESDQRVFDATCRKLHKWIGSRKALAPGPVACQTERGTKQDHDLSLDADWNLTRVVSVT